MTDVFTVIWSSPRRRRFFEWRGASDDAEAALAWATADMMAAWEAVCAASGWRGAALPSYVEGKAPKTTMATQNAAAFVLRYLPTWQIGSAMIIEMGDVKRHATPRGMDIMKAHDALVAHEAARRRRHGQAGRVELHAEVNGAAAATLMEVAYGLIVEVDDSVAYGPGAVAPCPVVSRAAMAPLAMKIAEKGRGAGGTYGAVVRAEPSATLAAAKAKASHIASKEDVLAWYEDIGLAKTAESLRGLPRF